MSVFLNVTSGEWGMNIGFYRESVIGCISSTPHLRLHIKQSNKSLVHRPRMNQRADMAHIKTKSEAAQLSPEMIKNLIEQSHEVKKQSHSPYSKFRVGSALLTVDNRVITGKTTCETWLI